MNRLNGKVALVTGGALGIGRASCERMCEEGAAVAITDVLDREGEQTAAELNARGGKAAYWHLDVRDEAEVQAVLHAVRHTFGRLDVLVNNAGITGVNKPTHEVSSEEWDALMAVNVKGVFFCTKHAIPHLQQAGGGSIINLSSIYGLVGGGDVPPYHAAKGAVRLMTKNDALLYAADKIRVNSIHPGFIWTPMVRNLFAQQEHPPQSKPAEPVGAGDAGADSGLRGGGKVATAVLTSPSAVAEVEREARLSTLAQAVGALHPLGHMGEPDDIAWAVVYLASDEAKFITGSELVVDGGYTAR